MAWQMLNLSRLMMIQTTSDNIQSAALGPASKRWVSGYTLMEVMFAMMVVILLGASMINSLMFCERFAARTRLYTNARAIVQRNLDAATGVLFTGTTTTPAILSTTSSAGTVCDDDGGTGVPVENIQVLKSGTNVLVTGTLTRFVTNESVYVSSAAVSDTSAVVLRVTFQVNYNYLAHDYSYAETTLRSVDSQ